MYKTEPSSYQTTINLTAGLAMLASSLSIFTQNLNILTTPLLIIIGVFTAYHWTWAVRINQLMAHISASTHFGQVKPISSSSGVSEPTHFDLTWRKLVSDLMPATISTSMAMNPLDAKFDAQVELILYDIIVEATKNIVQHAQAKVAEVKIDVLEKTTLLFIQDDGVGFTVRDVMPNATGLLKIKKQVEALSGTVMFDSAEGKGTAILIEFPNEQS